MKMVKNDKRNQKKLTIEKSARKLSNKTHYSSKKKAKEIKRVNKSEGKTKALQPNQLTRIKRIKTRSKN